MSEMYATVPPAWLPSPGKRCPDKTRYPDKLPALMALSHMRSKGRGEKRVYHCRHCRGWHLTRQPYRHRGKGWDLGLA